MLEELLRSGFAALGLNLEPRALERYRIYFEYLEEMNKLMNLTAISGEEDVARLHFLDCAQLMKADSFAGKRVIDVGTGAGFPGLALKIACPEMELTLLDSLDKRIGFLRNCCERMDIRDVDCIHARAEEIPEGYRESFDFALSRAVARLNILCEMCLPYVKKGGAFIAMKGSDLDQELKEAEKAVALLGGKVEQKLDYTIPGTDVTHSLLIIRKLGNTPGKYPRRWAQIKKSPL